MALLNCITVVNLITVLLYLYTYYVLYKSLSFCLLSLLLTNSFTHSVTLAVTCTQRVVYLLCYRQGCAGHEGRGG